MIPVSQPVQHFKVILLGDGNVGKTSFLRNIIIPSEKFDKYWQRRYQTQQLQIATTKGLIAITIFDTAGQEKLGGLRQHYYTNTDGALLMYDVTTRLSYKNLPKWYKDLTRIRENVDVVVLGNKIDSELRKVKPNQIKWPTKVKVKYMEISVKWNYGINRALQELVRKMSKDQNLQFIQPVALKPPQKQIDYQLLQKMQGDWQAVRTQVSEEDEDQF